MRISIKDVALRANVSRGTVSHVLNGNVEARIAPETQERVRKAATELGYIPNQMAKSLFRGKTQLIGVLMTGIENPFFTELLGASETAIAEAGYRRLVDASIPYIAKARPEILSVWPVDGILMHAAIGRVSEGVLGAPVSHVPVVYLDSPVDAHRDTVQFDLRPGMAAAADHLLSRGHRLIGIVSPYDPFDLFMKQRHQALNAAAQELGARIVSLKLDENSRRGALNLGLRIAAMPSSERPTALLCHNDHLAIGVYHGVRRAGLRVPEEIAIVGVDGIEEADCLDKPLSTIKTPVEELCRIAVTMLRERIEGAVDCPPRHRTVASVFQPKGTT
ncbi:LacI family transcriptional regulator [Capsulimonas corticalis]|uniref:LacI family transcriptional regulator n=1 Tax=Capsulimonas corticalis TaxID=2219043 RepID=A0A402CSD5_9BACT|nr:LacI family DNA-binding transcriptional regulator [Capsulimonas corticalis]BDI31118.1 LacI family transcriptional regulator [Capsulimonas corticalis]